MLIVLGERRPNWRCDGCLTESVFNVILSSGETYEAVEVVGVGFLGVWLSRIWFSSFRSRTNQSRLRRVFQ
ncbi:hypothetical protein N665_0157s0031 [Sinapis alba]|nr:hypothetical protein N665_0157s0031 [Sinapis alba]